MFYSWKADVFIHRLSNNVYYISVNRDQFLRQQKGHGQHKNVPLNKWQEILAVEDLLSGNSTSARTATWNPAPETKKKTSAYIDRLLKARTNHSWCRKRWSVLFCYLFNVEVVDRKSNALSYEYSITPTEWQHFSYYLLLEIYTSTTETRGRYVTVKTKEAVVYFLISHLLLTNRQDKKWND